jgi:S1-C subfamily serine protease
MLKQVLLLFLILHPAFGQSSKPLTRIEACQRFTPAIVGIQIPPGPEGAGLGTGFVVSSDGFILTAAHVVISKITHDYFKTIEVVMDDGNVFLIAKPVTPVKDISPIHDFALLKVATSQIVIVLKLISRFSTGLGTALIG